MTVTLQHKTFQQAEHLEYVFNKTVKVKIETYATLSELVEQDETQHALKDIATLFLSAMNDWPTPDQDRIDDFLKELEAYFGAPVTIENIKAKKFNGQNAWQLEAGSSIAEAIDLSTRFCNEADFNQMLKNVLSFYGNI